MDVLKKRVSRKYPLDALFRAHYGGVVSNADA
jgi:hypothetical protein